MASPLQNAMNSAAATTKAVAGVPITYSRGASSVSIALARKGFAKSMMSDEYGTSFETKIQDWIIDVADLAFASVATEPARGDRIAETVGGLVITYEVLPIAGEETHRYSDACANRWRIHTKVHSMEAA